MQIRYAKYTSQTTIFEVPLDPFKGNWVEVYELVTYGESGKYDLSIKRISDSANLLTYANGNIRMWKTDADFIRPKWGIYRSLNDSVNLRDEMLCFSDFSVYEEDVTSTENYLANSSTLEIYPNPAGDHIQVKSISSTPASSIMITDQVGRVVLNQSYVEGGRVNISSLDKGIYFVRLFSNNKIIAASKLIKH